MKTAVICGIVCMGALVSGLALMVSHGGNPPAWLIRSEMAVFTLSALACGFANLPNALPWLRLRSIQGTILVVLGVAAVYVPPQFLFSAVFIFLGLRLVKASLGDLESKTASANGTVARIDGRRPAGDDPKGTIRPKERHDARPYA